MRHGAGDFASQERRGGRGAWHGAGGRLHERDVRARAVAGRKLGVPLAQIEPIGADAATREAMADWRYWQHMGWEF
ncbi:MAG: calcium-binding protein [Casimicrobiaceae bacterium]